MPDEQKPDEKKPKRSAAMEERLKALRESGATVNESGKSIAIIGVSSGPADAAPQPAGVPKPDAPAGSSEAGQSEKREPKPARSISEDGWRILREAGAIDMTSKTPGAVCAMIGTGTMSSEPADSEPTPRPVIDQTAPKPKEE